MLLPSNREALGTPRRVSRTCLPTAHRCHEPVTQRASRTSCWGTSPARRSITLSAPPTLVGRRTPPPPASSSRTSCSRRGGDRQTLVPQPQACFLVLSRTLAVSRSPSMATARVGNPSRSDTGDVQPFVRDGVCAMGRRHGGFFFFFLATRLSVRDADVCTKYYRKHKLFLLCSSTTLFN